MFMTSQERKAMTSRGNPDSDRQNLLDRLLDAVKQCQVRYGGKTELATDSDSRVTCLLAQFLAIFNHGLKKPKGTVRAFMQVGQVAGITKQEELEPAFYNFIKEYLSKNEQERFLALHNIVTDTGRGRAWLRSTLNEHTLEKSIHNILGDKKLIRMYYEPYAFLLDEEKASMLPMIAAGVSSILFALGIDKEELDVVRQVSPQLPSSKEVFSNLLPSFPAAKPKPEPVAVLAESTQQDDTKNKKKKKKKKKSAAIATIDDGDSSNQGSTEELYMAHQNLHDFPFNDSSTYLSKQTKKLGHSRSSSYPGKIKVEAETLDQNLGTRLPKTDTTSEFDFGHQGILREISLSDTSLTADNKSNVTWTNNSEDNYENILKPHLITTSFGQSVDTIEEKDELLNDEVKVSGRSLSGTHGNNVITMEHDKDQDKGTDVDSCSGLLDNLQFETKGFGSFGSRDINFSNHDSKQEDLFAIKSFRRSKHGQNSTPTDDDKRQSLEESELGNQDILSTSVSKYEDTLLVMGGDDGLMPLGEHKTIKTQDLMADEPQAAKNQDGEEKEDRDSSKDSVSLSSNSWFDDNDDRTDQSEDDFLKRARSESLSAATEAAAAALEFCTPSHPKHLSSMSLDNEESNSRGHQILTAEHEGMTTSELKQAIVSMMLRKDEIEDQNRVLCQLVEEKRHEREVMEAETEKMKLENKTREDKDASRITALMRENEVLKHQLKKYVGAVQMLRSNMSDKNSVNLQGIRQDEVLPMLPEKKHDQDIDSESEANQYEQKLIQVAEMHGELMEFNERLQRQLNYWQAKSRRQQEELVSLRGPLPDDSSTHDSSCLSSPDISVVNNRPLINIWIPSVFLKGKGAAGVYHLYQMMSFPRVSFLCPSVVHVETHEYGYTLNKESYSLGNGTWSEIIRDAAKKVYIRIKDDEWNVYRRYSQFYELHKNICKKHKIAETFKFPSKKTFGNKGTKFVEERRKVLQEYIRLVVNLIISEYPELGTNTCKATLLEVMPFFGDPYPNKKRIGRQRKPTDPYDGL